jgi:hypothetical protein
MKKTIKKNSSKNYNKTKSFRQKGKGFFNDSETTPLNAVNRSFTTTVVLNGQQNKVDYILPYTFNLKKVNSILVPSFFVTLESNQPVKCNIKIGRRYVNYLVYINNDWYAIMRIFGINTGLLASFTSTVFIKLKKNTIHLNKKTNAIIFNGKEDNNYSILNNTALGGFRSSKNTLIQIFDDNCIPLNSKDDMFFVLRKFRNEQLVSYRVKIDAEKEALKVGFKALT